MKRISKSKPPHSKKICLEGPHPRAIGIQSVLSQITVEPVTQLLRKDLTEANTNGQHKNEKMLPLGVFSALAEASLKPKTLIDHMSFL